MFLLHRLRADNWKHLRDVDLKFPDEGAILVEGPNEAGKSSLFEAVFFALYGQGLLPIAISDLKGYGADALQVELEFSLGGREFSLSRRVGKNHTAKLLMPPINGEREAISGLNEIKKRLQEELRLTSDALLNTCFVEQKRLERLEDLGAEARRNTINELLNLRVLTRLESEFKVSRDDRDALEHQRERLQIARLDAELPQLQTAVADAERGLNGARAHELLHLSGTLQIQHADATRDLGNNAIHTAQIHADLQAVARFQSLEAAASNDLPLRADAWHTATQAAQAAPQRAQELEALSAQLPARAALLDEQEIALARLKKLEAAEIEAARGKSESESIARNLARFDELQSDWQAGRARESELQTQRDAAATELKHAQDMERARQNERTRDARLQALQERLEAARQSAHDAQELRARVEEAQEKAASLPDLRAQLQTRQDQLGAYRRQSQARLDSQRHQFDSERLQAEADAAQAWLQHAEEVEARRAQAERDLQAAVQRQTSPRHAAALMISLSLFILGMALCGAAWALSSPLLVPCGIGLFFGAIFLISRRGSETRAARDNFEKSRQARDATLSELQILNAQRGAVESRQEELARRLQTLESLQAGQEIAPLGADEMQAESVLESAIEAARRDISAGERQAEAARLLEEQWTLNLEAAQKEVERVARLAEELGFETLNKNGGMATEVTASTTRSPPSWTNALVGTLRLRIVGEVISVAPFDEDLNAWALQAQAERDALNARFKASPDEDFQARIESARAALLNLERQEAALQSEQAGLQKELGMLSRPELVAALSAIETELASNAALLAAVADARAPLETWELSGSASAIETQLALKRAEFEREQQEAAHLPAVRQEAARRQQIADERARDLSVAWRALLPGESVPVSDTDAQQQLTLIAARFAAARARFDEAALQNQRAILDDQAGELRGRIAALTHKIAAVRIRQHELLPMESAGEADDEQVEACLRELAQMAGERDVSEWQNEWEARREAERDHRAVRRARVQALRDESVGDAPLDATQEGARLAAIELDLAQKRRAGEIVARTRTSIVSRVMPLTLQNMRRLLPDLTEGRYQDAEWDEEQNVLAIYDARAGSFQRKRVFSGGARDQISLALRLAFALATLPGELNIQPGWLFLDEPLSSFDRARTQALVELLTHGLIRQKFQQIFLVSHSASFDPSQFDFRLRLENGRVVESNLPR